MGLAGSAPSRFGAVLRGQLVGGDFTPACGSAHRFESENAARYIGYSLKERGDIEDFTVEEILNPRTKR